MSRARSPRAAERLLGFDPTKIRRLGKDLRLARQYFFGGTPGEGIERFEDDPNYQQSWGMRLQDLSHQTGVPISSISEMENHAAYTVGMDTMFSLVTFLYLNSKNGDMLKDWLTPDSVFSLNQEISERNQSSGFKPVTLETISSNRNAASPVTKETYVLPISPSKDLITAIEYLLRDWSRLADCSVDTAVKVARFPVAEFEHLKSLTVQNKN